MKELIVLHQETTPVTDFLDLVLTEDLDHASSDFLGDSVYW